MSLPSTNTGLRGYLKPFQSELYFKKKAPGAQKYQVLRPALNYVASLTMVEAETSASEQCSISYWTGLLIGTPCPQGGAVGAVTNGYGIWIQDLRDEPDPVSHPNESTLLEANSTAIRIEGKGNYGRIQWAPSPTELKANPSALPSSAYRPSSGVLEFGAGTGTIVAVQTASGVNLNVGGSSGNAVCNAGGFRIGGAAAVAGHYLRGNSTNYVDGVIQVGDLPVANATTGGILSAVEQDIKGDKHFKDAVGVEKDFGVSQNSYFVGSVSFGGAIYPDSSGVPAASGTFTTADGKTVTVVKGIIKSIA
jgi:hypothetical protein